MYIRLTFVSFFKHQISVIYFEKLYKSRNLLIFILISGRPTHFFWNTVSTEYTSLNQTLHRVQLLYNKSSSDILFLILAGEWTTGWSMLLVYFYPQMKRRGEGHPLAPGLVMRLLLIYSEPAQSHSGCPFSSCCCWVLCLAP